MPRKRKRAIPPTVSVIDTADYYGWCDQGPDRCIWVNPREPDARQFETLIHEWLHRWFDKLNEDQVEGLGADFAEVAQELFIIKRRKKA